MFRAVLYSRRIASLSKKFYGRIKYGPAFYSLRELPKPLSFKTPDTAVVNSHFHGHPMPQCRLDTYFQGALCILSELEDVNQNDALVGNCNRIQGETLGVRPLCWFKPEK